MGVAFMLEFYTNYLSNISQKNLGGEIKIKKRSILGVALTLQTWRNGATAAVAIKVTIPWLV